MHFAWKSSRANILPYRTVVLAPTKPVGDESKNQKVYEQYLPMFA